MNKVYLSLWRLYAGVSLLMFLYTVSYPLHKFGELLQIIQSTSSISVIPAFVLTAVVLKFGNEGYVKYAVTAAVFFLLSAISGVLIAYMFFWY